MIKLTWYGWLHIHRVDIKIAVVWQWNRYRSDHSRIVCIRYIVHVTSNGEFPVSPHFPTGTHKWRYHYDSPASQPRLTRERSRCCVRRGWPARLVSAANLWYGYSFEGFEELIPKLFYMIGIWVSMYTVHCTLTLNSLFKGSKGFMCLPPISKYIL